MVGWFCRCRRQSILKSLSRQVEKSWHRRLEDDLVFELPSDPSRDGSPAAQRSALEPRTLTAKVTPTSEARKVLMTPRRHPRQDPKPPVFSGLGMLNSRRTRIFVRMPSGDILPADMDLDWTTTEASEYIIAPRLHHIPGFGIRRPGALHLADARALLAYHVRITRGALACVCLLRGKLSECGPRGP